MIFRKAETIVIPVNIHIKKNQNTNEYKIKYVNVVHMSNKYKYILWALYIVKSQNTLNTRIRGHTDDKNQL